MASDEEIVAYVERHDQPFITATEVAEKAGFTRQTAHKRLQELSETGKVQKKKIGASAVIWWCPSRCR
jgi:Fic family protein